MSTSIQEQDLIQTIKDLQQRISDLERQQRTIAIDTAGTKTVKIKKDFSSVQSERMDMSSNSIQYYYADTSGPLVDGGIVINFDVDRLDILNTGDFAPGTLNLYDISPAINNHDTSIPATITSTGTKGMIKWNATHLYLCTATNTWRRVAIGTW